jgi:hypothetical protein
MRKVRFPKAAYVRRLERLYAELSGWCEVYGRDDVTSWFQEPNPRLVERVQCIEHAQHQLRLAILAVYGIRDLS